MPLTATTLIAGLATVLIYLGNRSVMPRVTQRSPESTRRILARMNGVIGIFGVVLVLLGVLYAILGLR